jgi:hypothetical protein
LRTIKIQRPEENFYMHCSYTIEIDGKSIAKLENGEHKTIEIPDELTQGHLKAKINWCGSKKYSVKTIPENHLIEISGNRFLNLIMPISGAIIPIAGMALFSAFGPDMKSFGIGAIVLLMVGLVATLTVWWDRWLKLKML